LASREESGEGREVKPNGTVRFVHRLRIDILLLHQLYYVYSGVAFVKVQFEPAPPLPDSD
jgi:hypothetical protein